MFSSRILRRAVEKAQFLQCHNLFHVLSISEVQGARYNLSQISDSTRGGGAVAEWVRALASTGDRTVSAEFESHCGKLRFGTLAILFTPLCLSEETLKAVCPVYLVSMPGEVKDPTSPHWNV